MGSDGGSVDYPGNTGCEAGVHAGWDASHHGAPGMLIHHNAVDTENE